MQQSNVFCNLPGADTWQGIGMEMLGVWKPLPNFRDLVSEMFKTLNLLARDKGPFPTCRGKTRRDYMFLSPELIRRFVRCELDPLAWTDHAVIKTWFHGNDGCEIRSVWPVPGQVDWSVASSNRPDVVMDFAGTSNSDETYRQFLEPERKPGFFGRCQSQKRRCPSTGNGTWSENLS